MPLYNTATAAAALDVNQKWLDNILSHNDLDGVQSDTQGISRRLSVASIIALSLAKELIDGLEINSSAALRLATRILSAPTGGVVVSSRLRIVVDLDSLRADTLGRLERAVEIAPTPRRGRPPKR
jgi:hypothetical protein